MWTDTLTSHARLWNADDIEEMSALLFQGKDIPHIAKTMGRSQEAVRAKAQSLDMLPKRAKRRSVSGSSSAFF